MQVYIVLAVCVAAVYGQGAGRAIPIAAENYVIDLFRGVNRDIEYDQSNFLVDLSGNYANCDFIGRHEYTTINRLTPDGESIGLIQDSTRGDLLHTNAVSGYLETVYDSWVFQRSIAGAYGQISVARRFGCSVRPGCRGEVSVACLFSPAGFAPPPIDEKTTRRPITRPPKPTISGEQVAKAFTPQQYNTAELQTKQTWDRSHFLENLSGFETKCSLLTQLKPHEFQYAKDTAAVRGKTVVGLVGSAPNLGSTPDALTKIMTEMKADALQMVNDRQHGARLASFFDAGFRGPEVKSKEVGCSVIPDCMVGDWRDRDMWVVVTCVFEI